MAQIRQPQSVLLSMTIFSRYPEALSWAKEQSTARWGSLLLESELFSFNQTSFYKKQMGEDLQLQIILFSELVCPSVLAEVKIATNHLEGQYAAGCSHPEPRPLNIDPGYLASGKFVLATTKDASHRIYLQQGIFAESTLYYVHGSWRTWPWTYPNYCEPGYRAFLSRGREELLGRTKF